MKSPFLLEMTGSEPLTLEEEVEMQQSWRDDEEKCTFIILGKSLCRGEILEAKREIFQHDPNFVEVACSTNIAAMIGDINLFLSDEEMANESEIEENPRSIIAPTSFQKQAELDVMIAEESFRGKGIGKEAVCMMMIYGAQTLGIRRYFVKIKDKNVLSRHLFETSLGFKECNYVECFCEVELELKKDSTLELIQMLRQMLKTQIPENTCSM